MHAIDKHSDVSLRRVLLEVVEAVSYVSHTTLNLLSRTSPDQVQQQLNTWIQQDYKAASAAAATAVTVNAGGWSASPGPAPAAASCIRGPGSGSAPAAAGVFAGGFGSLDTAAATVSAALMVHLAKSRAVPPEPPAYTPLTVWNSIVDTGWLIWDGEAGGYTWEHGPASEMLYNPFLDPEMVAEARERMMEECREMMGKAEPSNAAVAVGGSGDTAADGSSDAAGSTVQKGFVEVQQVQGRAGGGDGEDVVMEERDGSSTVSSAASATANATVMGTATAAAAAESGTSTGAATGGGSGVDTAAAAGVAVVGARVLAAASAARVTAAAGAGVVRSDPFNIMCLDQAGCVQQQMVRRLRAVVWKPPTAAGTERPTGVGNAGGRLTGAAMAAAAGPWNGGGWLGGVAAGAGAAGTAGAAAAGDVYLPKEQQQVQQSGPAGVEVQLRFQHMLDNLSRQAQRQGVLGAHDRWLVVEFGGEDKEGGGGGVVNGREMEGWKARVLQQGFCWAGRWFKR